MPMQFVTRSSELLPSQSQQLPNANTIRVDTDTETLKFGVGSSGSAEKELLDLSTAQVVTGVKTFTGGTVGPVEAGVVGTPLSGSGLSNIASSTSPAPFAYTLPLPVAGARKTIANIVGTTSGTATVTTAAGSVMVGTGNGLVKTIATFTTAGGNLELLATTSSQWGVLTYTTGVVLT